MMPMLRVSIQRILPFHRLVRPSPGPPPMPTLAPRSRGRVEAAAPSSIRYATSGSARTPCWPPPSVGVLPLLHGRPAVVGRVQQLGRQLAPTCVFSGRDRAEPDQPAHATATSAAPGAPRPAPGTWSRPPGATSPRRPACTLSTACLNSLSASCFARSSMMSSASYMIRSASAPLAPVHHHVDELRHQPAPVLRVREDLSALNDGPSRHAACSWLRGAALGRLRAVLGSALPAVRHPRRVERSRG